MSDEETWERRWIKACRTIAEREEKIEQLQKEYANLEASWNARPTGTRSQRESQLEKEVEQLRGHNSTLEAQLVQMRKDAVSVGRDMYRLVEQKDALEAQVKRLLAKEGERISKALVRKDANGDPIPWAKEHDYFMAFDPENPDIPTD